MFRSTRLASSALLLFSAFLHVAAQTALTNDDVIKLLKSGLGEEVVVAKINASATKFDTSAEALVKLKTDGATDRVIAAMIGRDAFEQDVTSAIPEAGSIRDLKGKKKYFLIVSIKKYAPRITGPLSDTGFTTVDKIEDADFVLNYEQHDEGDGWSRVTLGTLTAKVLVRTAGTFRAREIWSVQKKREFSFNPDPVGPAVKQFIADLK